MERTVAEETVPQMRERIEAQNKELSKLRSENTELKTETRRFGARDAFREAGLAPTHGDLFAAQNPEGEITSDAVKEFAQTYNLTPTPVTETDEPAPEPTEEAAEDPGKGLEAFSRGGSRAGSEEAATPAESTITKEEFKELEKSDPVAARNMLLQGRVQLAADNPYVRSGQYGG